MSRKNQRLRDIEERKRLLMAQADIYRSTLLIVADPVIKTIRAAEIGFIAMRAGQAIMQHRRS